MKKNQYFLNGFSIPFISNIPHIYYIIKRLKIRQEKKIGSFHHQHTHTVRKYCCSLWPNDKFHHSTSIVDDKDELIYFSILETKQNF